MTTLSRKQPKWSCPIRGTYCPEHGYVHGYEAEELRKGVEILLDIFGEHNGWDETTTETLEAYNNMRDSLQKLIDNVDARDSCAFREAGKRSKRVSKSLIELNVMLVALLRDAKDFFSLGAYRARKKLTNGAVVTFSIRMPKA